MKKSILVDDMEHCIICGKYAEEHHVFFGTANRKMAEKYHLTLPLCQEHHRNGPNSPHKNRSIDLSYKCWAQFAYEQNIGTMEDFRREFGRSYI